MSSPDFYHTIEKEGKAEYKDRGSRFLAFAYPVSSKDDFKQKLTALKKEHPKAVHHCFAYRLGVEGVNFRSSDDGEPSGSAGKPILNQIDSKQLTDVVIFVIRYFGGTLLGVPGLINAYKSAALLAVESTQITQKKILTNYQLEFDYTKMNEVMRIVKQFDLAILKKEMQLFCTMEIGIPNNLLEEGLFHLNQVSGLRFVESNK